MNRRKRKPDVPWAAVICISSVLIMLIIIAVLAVSLHGRTRQVKRLLDDNESMWQELSEGTGQGMGEETVDQENMSQENAEQENTGRETAGEDAKDASTEAETTVPETTEAPTEPEPQKIGTLDGVAAGTVVTADELDLSDLGKYFQAYEIKETGACYQRINGKSYRENPNVALSDLRYLKVLHYNFNHERQVGEIIVNAGITKDVLEIFRELYDAEYEIESMHLVDNYWTGDGDTSDSASIDVNNTSAFNYRVATGSSKLSNHAYGRAIDINPQQNPYVNYKTGKPVWAHENANDYIARDTGLPHVITHEDTAYKVFAAHGFTWGGDWGNPKDYQHFEKK